MRPPSPPRKYANIAAASLQKLGSSGEQTEHLGVAEALFREVDDRVDGGIMG